MEKDIDELLDEVETTFVNKTSNKATEKKGNAKIEPKKTSKSALSAAIDDILDIDVDAETDLIHKASSDAAKCEKNRSEPSGRCFPVFLGGSMDSMGRGTSVNTRACDQLRCTACDFKVCHFPDLAWNRDTDYLFLRNNVPQFQKLKPKLNKKKGCRAYCCQCSWRNVEKLCELNDPDLKWVCGKH